MATPLREIFARFGVDFDTRELERGDQKTKATTRSLGGLDEVAEHVSGTIKNLGASIAGVFAVGAVQQMITGTVQATREIERWSQRLNTNVQSITAWSRVAEPFGVDLEDMADGLKELQLKAQDALTGGTAQAEMFGRIGISLDDLRPVVNDVNGLMELFVERLDDVSDAGLRNFTVDELMSDAGTRLLPVFRMGSERLRDLRREAEKASEPTARLAERMTDWSIATGRFNTSLESLRATFVLGILPSMEKVIGFGTQLSGIFQGLISDQSLVTATGITAGIAVAGVAAASVSTWGPAALGASKFGIVLGVAALAVEDLLVTIQGGDSVTREFVDGLFGVGATAKAIDKVKASIQAVHDVIVDTISVLSESAIGRRIIGGLTLQPQRQAFGRLARGDVFGAGRSLVGEDLVTGIGGGLDRLARGDVAGGARFAAQSLYGTDPNATAFFGRSRARRQVSAEDAQFQQDREDFGALLPEFFDGPRDMGIQSGLPTDLSSGVTFGNTTITVNGTSDPRETAALVERAVQDANDRQARQIEAALVPAGTS
jgi:hypothetical protein